VAKGGREDVMLVEFDVKGKFVEPYGELKPNNRDIAFHGVSELRFNKSGLIESEECFYDSAKLLEELKK
jgi:hypothetical protein